MWRMQPWNNRELLFMTSIVVFLFAAQFLIMYRYYRYGTVIPAQMLLSTLAAWGNFQEYSRIYCCFADLLYLMSPSVSELEQLNLLKLFKGA